MRNFQKGGHGNVPMPEWDVIVIGGGAAGLFCAIEAGKRGRRVLLLEHSDTVGRKIKISGGGRCNFTNIYTNSDNFTSLNPHFCKSALARYTPADFVSLVESTASRITRKSSDNCFVTALLNKSSICFGGLEYPRDNQKPPRVRY